MATTRKNTTSANKSTGKTSTRSSTGRKSTKGSVNRKTNSRKKKAAPSTNTEDIIYILSIALCVLLMLANFGLCGKASEFLNIFTFGFFGSIGYVSPLFGLVLIFVIISNRQNVYVLIKLAGSVMAFIILCSIAWMFSLPQEMSVSSFYDISLHQHLGGGFFGSLLVMIIHPVFGNVGSWLIFVVLFVILIIAITGFSPLGYFSYMKEKISDNYDAGSKIRQMKNEERALLREQELLENRKKNAEKMLKASQNLDGARRTASEHASFKEEKGPLRTEYVNSRDFTIERNKKRSNPVNAPEKGDIENPFKSIIETEIKTKNKTEKVKVDTNTGEIIEEPKKPKPVIIDHISKRKNITNEPVVSDSSQDSEVKPVKKINPLSFENITSVISAKQMEVKDIEPVKPDLVETEKEENKEPAYINGFPARKPFHEITEPDKDIVTQTASGKIIVAEPGNGGTKKAADKLKEVEESASLLAEPSEPIKLEPPAKEYIFPPYNLLKYGDNKESHAGRDAELENTANKLVETLKTFGVNVSTSCIVCGPTVTRFELTPELGVKISKIVSLQDDIKLALAATDIRIEAPIPGKAAIGIEVPNKESTPVSLREMIDSDDFRNSKPNLSFAVGVDIGGKNIIGNIAKMPHLLIAGQTGSGKSVCINAMIVSILYHAKPKDVRLLMIDPKKVELTVYNGIPHLIRPVVADAKQAAGALSWAVGEMTRRYETFSAHGVRDISGYNDKLLEKYKGRENEMPKNAYMSQIVIIVDELADLMMAAPSEVEDSIMHLAQMARAAGMHLILATQRPSVNVITGVIKANIPSRIALKVASGVDSRTILDTIGADKLLGHGDMLYFPTGLQKPIRVQGAYVSDAEIENIVDFIKNQGKVNGGGYDETVDLTAVAAMSDGQTQAAVDAGKDDDDALLTDAGMLITQVQKASIGMLQRKFRIGFNRAARIMDQLAEKGVVGEEEGTKPRAVLMTQEEFEQFISKN